jgi:Ni,Fe-hydrogenase I large subunit
MSIQGEITISLNCGTNGISSEITSSRPMKAAQLFSGKTIEQTLKTVPLLFNICSKAQAVTAVRAIESATDSDVDGCVESQREAIVMIESLREHSLQVLMKWPDYIGEALNNEVLSKCVQSLNKLMQSFEPQKILHFGIQNSESVTSQQCALWEQCKEQLSNAIFGLPVAQWQQNNHEEIIHWGSLQNTQAARFLYWLNQQDWKYAGSSNIKLLSEINDLQLVTRITTEQESFTAQPDWESRCYETSWFNYQQDNSVIKQLRQEVGNGIYTRIVARLIEVADLMTKLHSFFHAEIKLNRPVSMVKGLAHTDAARGRLSHYVQVESGIVRRLFILAPTEWNFHPKGVAANSLCHLDNSIALRLQADLLIHAIDPCVGYQLQINNEVTH